MLPGDTLHPPEEFGQFPFHLLTEKNLSDKWSWGWGGAGYPDGTLMIDVFEGSKRDIWVVPECLQVLMNKTVHNRKEELKRHIRQLIGAEPPF